MKRATLCFILRDRTPREVLLGLKKRGFGVGKVNGFGGKIQPGESIREAAVREVAEESHLIIHPESLRPAGTVTFYFPYRPSFDHHVRVFTTVDWTGSPVETDEMAPSWFRTDRLPFHRMWADDAHWLPLVLDGKQVDASFAFAADNETLISHSVREIESKIEPRARFSKTGIT